MSEPEYVSHPTVTMCRATCAALSAAKLPVKLPPAMKVPHIPARGSGEVLAMLRAHFGEVDAEETLRPNTRNRKRRVAVVGSSGNLLFRKCDVPISN